MFGGIYFFIKPENNDFPNNMGKGPVNATELTEDDVAVGDYITAFMEGDGVSRIMVCENAEACRMFNGKDGGPAGNQQPPNNNQKPDTGDRATLSGTIAGKDGQNLTIQTDDGNSETIVVSDSTRIIKRD